MHLLGTKARVLCSSTLCILGGRKQAFAGWRHFKGGGQRRTWRHPTNVQGRREILGKPLSFCCPQVARGAPGSTALTATVLL